MDRRRIDSRMKCRRSHPLLALLRWVRRYPFASLVITWMCLLALGSLAAISLTILDAQRNAQASVADQMSFSSAATFVVPEVEIAPTFQPIVLVSAIALCCALVCWLWFRTPSSQDRANTKASAEQSNPFERPFPPKRTVQSPRAPSFEIKRAKVKAAIFQTDLVRSTQDRSEQEPPTPAQQSAANATNVQIAPVSVVPSQQSHPLDWNEPSLADHLDLRRRRSFSDWL